MATWNGICSTSADDARETAAANTINDSAIVLQAAAHNIGLRFQSCPVAPTDTVTSATLTVNITTTVRDSPDGLVWSGFDIADVAAFTTSLGELAAQAKTTATVTWSGTNIGSGDHNIDVTSIFNEIITNGLYTTGNDVGLMGDASGSTDVSIRAYDGSTTDCARLTVIYTAAGGSTQPPRTMHQFRMRG